jgi:hypothetical protein
VCRGGPGRRDRAPLAQARPLVGVRL